MQFNPHTRTYHSSQPLAMYYSSAQHPPPLPPDAQNERFIRRYDTIHQDAYPQPDSNMNSHGHTVTTSVRSSGVWHSATSTTSTFSNIFPPQDVHPRSAAYSSAQMRPGEQSQTTQYRPEHRQLRVHHEQSNLYEAPRINHTRRCYDHSDRPPSVVSSQRHRPHLYQGHPQNPYLLPHTPPPPHEQPTSTAPWDYTHHAMSHPHSSAVQYTTPTAPRVVTIASSRAPPESPPNRQDPSPTVSDIDVPLHKYPYLMERLALLDAVDVRRSQSARLETGYESSLRAVPLTRTRLEIHDHIHRPSNVNALMRRASSFNGHAGHPHVSVRSSQHFHRDDVDTIRRHHGHALQSAPAYRYIPPPHDPTTARKIQRVEDLLQSTRNVHAQVERTHVDDGAFDCVRFRRGSTAGSYSGSDMSMSSETRSDYDNDAVLSPFRNARPTPLPELVDRVRQLALQPRASSSTLPHPSLPPKPPAAVQDDDSVWNVDYTLPQNEPVRVEKPRLLQLDSAQIGQPEKRFFLPPAIARHNDGIWQHGLSVPRSFGEKPERGRPARTTTSVDKRQQRFERALARPKSSSASQASLIRAPHNYRSAPSAAGGSISPPSIHNLPPAVERRPLGQTPDYGTAAPGSQLRRNANYEALYP